MFYLDHVASFVALTLRPKSGKELDRRDRMREAAASFPNDTCGYVRNPKRNEPEPSIEHTVEDRRRQLKDAFENPRTDAFQSGRLRRGRTRRNRIVGVVVYGKSYRFNGPIDWEAAVSGIAAA